MSNGLDEQFQLGPDHDPNHIFDQEYELIEEVRSKMHPRLDGYTDRFIVVFLFARKHNVKRTIKLLNTHLDFMDSQGFAPAIDGVNPIIPGVDFDEVCFNMGDFIYKQGNIDNSGRMLMVRKMGHFYPDRIEPDSYMKSIAWFWYEKFEKLDLSMMRNGMCTINDMDGMTKANFDFSSRGRKMNNDMMNIFPVRFRQGLIINTNMLFKAVMAFSRLVFKAKMIRRLKVVKVEELINYIPIENLPIEYGGEWDHESEPNWFDVALEELKPKKKKRRRRKKKVVHQSPGSEEE
eukprot:TRINITY_DN980_c2_g2_i2.p1 TRINITY_DN980_c2_g2~~TRINITY_DN980_c2_g2_i2.p1  ORF type:complete len:291 (-),score=65.19 TRINITY_DN980_c2_g2_i2:42-914(-)